MHHKNPRAEFEFSEGDIFEDEILNQELRKQEEAKVAKAERGLETLGGKLSKKRVYPLKPVAASFARVKTEKLQL